MRKTLYLLAGALVAFLLVALGPKVVGVSGPSDAGLSFADAMADGLPVALGVVFLGGLLTSLTPCVYPLIPITVAVFGARSSEGRLKGALLSLIYILGMAVMYSSLGLAAALTGQVFGAVMSNPWVIGTVALVFTVFAISMLGAFDFNLPPSLQTKLATVGGEGFVGAFLMGLVSGVVAAPCTGPVLGGVLTWVATTQDALLGTVLLFTFAMGMGVLFFVLGTFSVSLPKSGTWMDAVKSVFAVAMLAVALFFLKDVVPPLKAVLVDTPAVGWLTGVAAAAGVLIGGVHLTYHGGWGQRILKTAGVVLLVSAVYYRAGALTVVDEAALAGDGPQLEWVHDERETLARATAEKKPVMIDFTADWCAACKELQKITFPHPTVARELQRFVVAKIDLTDDETEEYARLKEKYGLPGLPYVVFYDSKGKRLDALTVTGFQQPEVFMKTLVKVK